MLCREAPVSTCCSPTRFADSPVQPLPPQTAVVCMISAVGAAAMFTEPLLAPPTLRNDVLRVLACYAFWFKGACECVLVFNVYSGAILL